MSYKQLFVVGGLLLACVLSYAQTPPRMSYQGLLTTSSGTPVQDGNYNLKFDMYNLPAAGTLKHTETHNNVPVQRGTFSVILGPLPAIFVESLYVEVTALSGPGIPSPVTFSPRSELTAAPYALAPWSIIGSDIAYLTGGHVLIGVPPTPLGILTVMTAGPFAPTPPASPTRAAIGFGPNFLTLGADPVSGVIQGFQLDMTTPLDLSLQQFGGNVGVGLPPATPPQFLLDVNGTARIYGSLLFGAAANAGIRDSSGIMQFKDFNTGWTSFSGLGGGGPANAWLLNGNAAVAGNFLGTTNLIPLELRANNTPVSTFTPIGGTATIVSGWSGNNGWASTGATISGGGGPFVGSQNVTDDFCTIGGGAQNQAGDNNPIPTDAMFATVGGGIGNFASGAQSTVGGGINNIASGSSATIAGGDQNIANSMHATVGGGWMNNAGKTFSVVAGGVNNNMTTGPAGGADTTAIGGGAINDVFDHAGTIAGGTHNAAGSNNGIPTDATHATIGGGFQNTAGAAYATVSGGQNNTAGALQGTIGGGFGNAVGPGAGTTVGGGLNNQAQITGATVGGGMANIAGQTVATVGGGMENNAISAQSTIAGGMGNVTAGQTATIGGGHMNQIQIQCDLSTISGGGQNVVANMATYAAIPGGEANLVEADHSLAAGWQAQVGHRGSFVWADAFNAPAGQPFRTTQFNQFAVRAQGGAYFELTSQVAPLPALRWVNIFNDGVNLITTSTGARLTLGGVWTNASDRNLKENFSAVKSRDVLEKLSRLPISLWNYKTESAEIRHMGPTAQDFYEIFGLGGSDKTISTIDPSGVALAAIQELHKQNEELRARVADLEILVKSLTSKERTGEGTPLGEAR